MVKKVYVVDLTSEEREELLGLLKGSRTRFRKSNRARGLLLADEGRTDEDIAEALLTSVCTVERTRRRFVEGGLGRALEKAPRPGWQVEARWPPGGAPRGPRV